MPHCSKSWVNYESQIAKWQHNKLGAQVAQSCGWRDLLTPRRGSKKHTWLQKACSGITNKFSLETKFIHPLDSHQNISNTQRYLKKKRAISASVSLPVGNTQSSSKLLPTHVHLKCDMFPRQQDYVTDHHRSNEKLSLGRAAQKIKNIKKTKRGTKTKSITAWRRVLIGGNISDNNWA